MYIYYYLIIYFNILYSYEYFIYKMFLGRWAYPVLIGVFDDADQRFCLGDSRYPILLIMLILVVCGASHGSSWFVINVKSKLKTKFRVQISKG